MENKKLNREWVKTFAIIFLAIMLVLTFFSNTIMNMTLPEVSTEYIQYGSIKTQVRGSGSVVALDNFAVMFPATRDITKVAVSQGQYVKKGDVLLYLADTESDELIAARDAYDNLFYEYTKMQLDAKNAHDFSEKELALSQVQEDLKTVNDKLAAFANTELAIDKAKSELRLAEKAVTEKQNEINDLESEKNAIGYTPTEDEVLTGKQVNVTYEEYMVAATQIDAIKEKIDAAEKEYNALKVKADNAANEYNQAKKEYDAISAKIEIPLKELEKQIQQSDRNIDALDHDLKYLKQEFYTASQNKELERLYDDFKDEQKAYRRAKVKYDELLNNPGASAEDIKAAKDAYMDAKVRLDDAFEAYDAVLTDQENVTGGIERQLAAKETELNYALEDNTEMRSKLTETKKWDAKLAEQKSVLDAKETVMNDAEEKAVVAQTVLENANVELKTVEKDLEKVRNGYKFVKVKEYEDKIENEKMALDGLQDIVKDKTEYLRDLENLNPDSEEALKTQKKTLERQLLTAQKDLQNSKDNAQDQIQIQNLDLKRKKKELDRAEQEVQNLEKRYAVTEITSPVEGVVETVNVLSGQKTKPDQSLVDIALADNGYKMTLSVTQQQAAKLRVGAPVEITSYIPYGSEITASLTAIKNDTANPASRQKILEITLSGDVENGRNLSVSIGDKNVSYDSVVPNTAIKEDSNGKYVLVVESKSTPISTRYIAKRVDVTVLASDDTRSAISGDFENYSYVIATSSAPIESGKQVKLIED